MGRPGERGRGAIGKGAREASLARVESGLKADVEGFLDGQLKETVEEMAALLNDPENPPTQSMLYAVQRHRDVLEDYKVDFKRTKARVCLLWDIVHYRWARDVLARLCLDRSGWAQEVADASSTRVTCNMHWIRPTY